MVARVVRGGADVLRGGLMHRVRITTQSLVAAGLVAATVGTASAQAPAVVVSSDKTVYTPPNDLVAIVSVAGLTACRGKTVQVGLFVDAANPTTGLVGAVVDATGRASAQVSLPVNNSVVLHAGVTGEACIPGGTVVSPQNISVQELDAKQPTPTPSTASPGPPSVGTGARGDPGGGVFARPLGILLNSLIVAASIGSSVLAATGWRRSRAKRRP